MAKFKMQENVTAQEVFTARLGTAGLANRFTDTEVGKAVKLSGDSAYILCVAGDNIEGFITVVESAPLDDFSVGGVFCEERKEVVLDGLQATPGTGAIAIGDFVVAGTMVAKGTALTGTQKVCKSTVQIGSIPADLTAAGVMAKAALFAWRLVSASGTAVGSTGVIERVNG